MLTFIAPFVLLQASAETPPQPPAAPPPACESEAHAGFDLWVGEWKVFPNGSDTQVANSRIERMSGGCSIRETWMPFRGYGGQSISMLNHTTGRWQQTWVGADGKRVDFEGGVVDGAMVLTGYWDDVNGPGQDALIRMTYSKLDDGSVRQHGEASTDHGLSWQTSFDLIYRAKDTTDL
ncbi:hypothetical protein CD351_10890 [Erythrobacter sp. KY5]|uniref:hypothetical protein n=1 Tax=Erythrobacter sp. KY5 TaxID=2011159 RepID=UPI000DBEFA20|nr:hypothetical protein [Erythrobacter sp. KY5]AWW74931.1 hypothetical protein CD351_10890 [Erythrobacter sp. KY5]